MVAFVSAGVGFAAAHHLGQQDVQKLTEQQDACIKKAIENQRKAFWNCNGSSYNPKTKETTSYVCHISAEEKWAAESALQKCLNKNLM